MTSYIIGLGPLVIVRIRIRAVTRARTVARGNAMLSHDDGMLGFFLLHSLRLAICNINSNTK